MFFAVKSRKQCEISVEVVETCPFKLASADLRPDTGEGTGQITLRHPPCALHVPILSISLNSLV